MYPLITFILIKLSLILCNISSMHVRFVFLKHYILKSFMLFLTAEFPSTDVF